MGEMATKIMRKGRILLVLSLLAIASLSSSDSYRHEAHEEHGWHLVAAFESEGGELSAPVLTESFECKVEEFRLEWTTTSLARDVGGSFTIFVITEVGTGDSRTWQPVLESDILDTRTGVAEVAAGQGRYQLIVDAMGLKSWGVNVGAYY